MSEPRRMSRLPVPALHGIRVAEVLLYPGTSRRLEVLHRTEFANATVVVLPDTGKRYLSTPLYTT